MRPRSRSASVSASQAHDGRLATVSPIRAKPCGVAGFEPQAAASRTTKGPSRCFLVGNGSLDPTLLPADRHHTQQVMPTTVGAHLDEVRREVVTPSIQFDHFPFGGDTSTKRWQPRAEHVGDEHDFGVFANRAGNRTWFTQGAGGSDQLGMGITDLVLR